MKTQVSEFSAVSRMLHWITAAAVLAMLFIGVTMVASVAHFHLLLAIHRPLGIVVLVLVVVQFANRLVNSPSPYPLTMGRAECFAAMASEYTMYALMFLLPLIGWGMLSAARTPIVLFGRLHLPFILPHNAMLYAILRQTHIVLAYAFFFTIIAHFGAVLFHALIVRDGLFQRMTLWPIRRAGLKSIDSKSLVNS
jgi:cytochrome b561